MSDRRGGLEEAQRRSGTYRAVRPLEGVRCLLVGGKPEAIAATRSAVVDAGGTVGEVVSLEAMGDSDGLHWDLFLFLLPGGRVSVSYVGDTLALGAEPANLVPPAASVAAGCSLVVARTRDLATRVEAFARTYNLRGRKAELLVPLVTGVAPKVIAGNLATSYSTVRVYLKEVYEACSVEDRAALVARFWYAAKLFAVFLV